MLLRNTNIEKTVGIHIPEALQSGTVRHGCRNGHHPFIPLPQLAHYRRKYICIIRYCPGVGRDSGLNIKRFCPMKSGRVFLRRPVPFALLGQYMDQHRTLDSFGFLNDLDQSLDIMSIHRA